MDPLQINALMIELLEVLHEQSVELDRAPLSSLDGLSAACPRARVPACPRARVPASRNVTATGSRLAGLQLRARQTQDDGLHGAASWASGKAEENKHRFEKASLVLAASTGASAKSARSSLSPA